MAHVTGPALRSKISADGKLELWLEDVTLPDPGADEVLIRVAATPINPSDIGVMFGPADLGKLAFSGTAQRPVVTGTVPAARLPALAARIGVALPAGNEGAGSVIAAGSDVQHLLGKTVAARGGGMYAQYRVVRAKDCLVLKEGTPARAGAAAFINPLTALAFIETMRHEGHGALVHSAAASNLGQMLLRICLADGIPLVNIVRSQEQVALLKGLGATHVLDSTAADFPAALTEALAETNATLGFDPIRGGTLAATMLTAMELAQLRRTTGFSPYGSTVHKQVYLYGGLDPSPTILQGNFGAAWSIGGWLVYNQLAKYDADTMPRLLERIGAELTTIFASNYTAEISLPQVLGRDTIAAYGKRATGEKFLVNPSLGD
jgi:NADPH:quinone reductase